MVDRVRMTAASVFANDRITLFPEGGPPEGVKGGTVTDGAAFETDLDHARDLNRLGLAKADNEADLENEGGELQPHYSVSNMQLAASQSTSTTSQTSTTGSSSGSTEARGETGSDGLDDMTIAELREHATTNGVDLGEAKKKDEILTALRAGLAAKTETA